MSQPDTSITEIWLNCAIATSKVADAIAKLGTNPKADIKPELAEAADRLAKGRIEIRQVLADRPR